MIKNNVTLGICEFVISQLTFLKREEKINKTLSIYDLLKKNNLGKLFLKVGINYIEVNSSNPNNLNNNNKYIRSSSATPIDSKKSPSKNYYSNVNTCININPISNNMFSNNHVCNTVNITTNSNGSSINNIKNIINSVNSNFSTNFSKYNNINGKFNINNSTKKNKNVNQYNTNKQSANKSQDSIKIEEQLEKEEIDKTRIDILFDDENIKNLDNIGKKINDFIEQFKQKFLLNGDEKTIKIDDISKEICREFVEKLFELQEIYYDDYNKANDFYQEFKKFLINYSENYRNLMKKTNRLNEAFESLNLKNEFANFINREENKHANETIDINKNEIKIFKNIFGLNYQSADILKYKEDLEKKKCNFIF